MGQTEFAALYGLSQKKVSELETGHWRRWTPRLQKALDRITASDLPSSRPHEQDVVILDDERMFDRSFLDAVRELKILYRARLSSARWSDAVTLLHRWAPEAEGAADKPAAVAPKNVTRKKGRHA